MAGAGNLLQRFYRHTRLTQTVGRTLRQKGNMFSEEFRQKLYLSAANKIRNGKPLAVEEQVAVLYALDQTAQQGVQLTAGISPVFSIINSVKLYRSLWLLLARRN